MFKSLRGPPGLFSPGGERIEKEHGNGAKESQGSPRFVRYVQCFLLVEHFGASDDILALPGVFTGDTDGLAALYRDQCVVSVQGRACKPILGTSEEKLAFLAVYCFRGGFDILVGILEGLALPLDYADLHGGNGRLYRNPIQSEGDRKTCIRIWALYIDPVRFIRFLHPRYRDHELLQHPGRLEGNLLA